ncbi:MAG: glycosyltransferase [Myxococcales bacterium]|nr:glycosyltransferase [Myxococcales bacterium]
MIHYMTSNGVGNAWVANELRAVAAEGLPVALHALRRPTDTFFKSEDIAAMDRSTNGLYPLPKARSVASFALAPIRFRQRFAQAAFNALAGEREGWRARLAGIWHLYVACDWATTQRAAEVGHIHSQWIHSGGTVAMYGAWLLGTPFSFTGHAADLFRDRVALTDKIRRAKFIICISEFHRNFYLDNGARPEQLQIAYCGIDTTHFSPSPRHRGPDEPYHIISSGRLVEKKGFNVLIDACAILRARGVNFRCTIGGSGPLESLLREQVRTAALGDLVQLTGTALKQEDIPSFMHGGDAYCLPCQWASDRDVDGLPQMLMEAMACGVPTVSTRLVGIPDLVIDGETGLLVEPEQPEALADALQRLMDDPGLGARLAACGRKRVLEVFDLSVCLKPLLERFRASLEAQ